MSEEGQAAFVWRIGDDMNEAAWSKDAAAPESFAADADDAAAAAEVGERTQMPSDARNANAEHVSPPPRSASRHAAQHATKDGAATTGGEDEGSKTPAERPVRGARRAGEHAASPGGAGGRCTVAAAAEDDALIMP